MCMQKRRFPTAYPTFVYWQTIRHDYKLFLMQRQTIRRDYKLILMQRKAPRRDYTIMFVHRRRFFRQPLPMKHEK